MLTLIIASVAFILTTNAIYIDANAIDSTVYDNQEGYNDLLKVLKHYDFLSDSLYEKKLENIRKIKEQRFRNALIMEEARHAEEDKISQLEDRYKKFDEMRGQPEYMDLEVNKVYQSTKLEENPPCPSKCFSYNPVCGSDRKVYNSTCHMLKYNCGYNVTTADWEMCRGKHFLCPSTCFDINDHVCGDDGKIYRNSCIMRRENCGTSVEIKPMNYCYKRNKDLINDDDSCPKVCEETYNPVCGSDGIIYYNECILQMWTCRKNIKVVEEEHCIQQLEHPKCPDRCLPIPDIVCGSDRKFYINYCKMSLENCGKNIKRMPLDYCRTTRPNKRTNFIFKKSR